jgi:uncharacterized membrane protein YhdT
MSREYKIGVLILMLWTLIVTVARAARFPNDFSEAHWLLDYRFGFMKRGLVGEVVSAVTYVFQVPVTEQLIRLLSVATFVTFCVAVLGVSVRVVQRAGWSVDAVLVVLVFLSSPFVVMSAHLIGYYDNIVIMLTILSIMLLLMRRQWIAISLQVLAVLVHENSLVLGFPVFCLAWLLARAQIQDRQATSIPSGLPMFALSLPVIAFLVIFVNQPTITAPDFVPLFTAHLAEFPFIERNAHVMVPVWLTTTAAEYFALQIGAYARNPFLLDSYGFVLPTVFTLLCFVMRAFRLRDISLESGVLLGICLMPLVTLLFAWDIHRIWTFSIVTSFLALWVFAETQTTSLDSSAMRFLALLSLCMNALVLTPLMDGQVDQLGFYSRLLWYAPVISGSLVIILARRDVCGAGRLSIRGRSIIEIIRPRGKKLPKD